MSSKWLAWAPKAQVYATAVERVPSKPSKPTADVGSVGFVAADEGLFLSIEVGHGVFGEQLVEAEGVAEEWLRALGANRARIVSFDDERTHRKSWNKWIADERNRVFSEGRKRIRALTTEGSSPQTSAFQRSFFHQLANLKADTSTELTALAKKGGIPSECTAAYLRWRPASN